MFKSGFNGNLYDAVNYVASIADESKRAEAAYQLFGKAAQDMLPLFNNGSAGLAELYAQVEALGGIMSEEALAACEAYQDAMTNLQVSFGAFKTGLMVDFLPGITDIMNGVANVLAGNGEVGTKEIKAGLDDVGNAFLKLKDDIGPILDEVWRAITTTLFSAENISKMIQGAGGLIYGLLSGLLGASESEEAQSEAEKTGINIGKGIIDGIDKTLKEYDWGGLLGDLLGNGYWVLDENGNAQHMTTRGYNKWVEEQAGHKHASGLTYVPYDNYAATLHRGEKIVPAGQNDSALSSEILAELKSLSRQLDSRGVYLDTGALVGNLAADMDAALGARSISYSRFSF